MSKKIILVLALLVTAVSAHASFDWKGNAGDVLVCGNSVTPLSLHEGKVKYGLNPISLSGNTLAQKIDFLLSRLALRSSVRAEQYKQELALFEKEATVFHGVGLANKQDWDNAIVPAGCRVEQVILFRREAYPEHEALMVNGDLWSLLDLNSQAIMLLDLFIYKEGAKRNPWAFHDASPIRKLTASLASKEWPELPVIDFIHILLDMGGFDGFDMEGSQYTRLSSEFDGIHATPVAGSAFVTVQGKLREIGRSYYLVLHANGQYSTLYFKKNENLLLATNETISTKYAVFYENGAVRSAHISQKSFKLRNGAQVFIEDGGVDFYEDGYIESADLPATLLPLNEHESFQCNSGRTSFDRNGYVRECSLKGGDRIKTSKVDLITLEDRIVEFNSDGSYQRRSYESNMYGLSTGQGSFFYGDGPLATIHIRNLQPGSTDPRSPDYGDFKATFVNDEALILKPSAISFYGSLEYPLAKGDVIHIFTGNSPRFSLVPIKKTSPQDCSQNTEKYS